MRKKIPDDKKKSKIAVTVNSELSELLDKFLEDKNVTRSKYIESLIRKDMNKIEK